MRTIESGIIEAMKEGKAMRRGSRDEVCLAGHNGACLYRLHGNLVACWNPEARLLVLGVPGGRWQTNTTKGRINAIARAFGAPGVWQKNFVWTWDDGVPYDGDRTFQL